ncbi:MAG: HD domain-containing phosphohydrolase, partial [Syntrophales bacterium]|nr:HD domain-containing phosphohydrolase [Syntrophales bacterium]
NEMNQHVNQKLIVRLLLAWIILSVLIGSVVFFMEMRKIDAYVVALALEESRDFERGHSNFLNNPDQLHLERLREETRKHIKDEHFIAVKLYNRDREMIVEANHPDARLIEEKINSHRLDIVMADDVHFKKFYGKGGQIYVMVQVPLKTTGRETDGYFEGVYKADPRTMAEIKSRILLSLLQVVVIIFFTALAIYPIVLFLNRGLIRMTGDLYRANVGMLKVLGGAIAKRDSDTNIHNYRVTIYAVRLAETIGLKRENIAGLIKGSFLHDVGKIAISDRILLKPGKLTDEEMAIMKTHVHHGVDIVGHYGWLKDSADVVRYHHEKFDGSGYEAGLKGHDIPINARIFAVADVFNALTSRRPYKEPFALEEAMRILMEGRENHFDPALVDSFAGIADSLYEEINGAGDKLLEDTLDELIDRYFSAGIHENPRQNCWEFMKCGREVGGAKAQELGVCPAYPDHGKHCARIVGTLCGGEVQASFARKFGNCWKCPFYRSRHYERMFGSADEK